MKAPAPSYLQQLLSEYRSGPVESSGTFTLDPTRAREMLRRFALESPHAWVLPAVASAVLGGAEAIEITARAGTIRLAYDGTTLTPDQLVNLYSSLLVGKSEPHLRDLAVAVNAARGLEPTVLALSTGRYRADFTTDPPAVEEGPAGSNVLEMARQPRRGLFGLWSKDDPLPEIDTIRARCRRCPLSIRLNGEEVTAPVDDGRAVISHHLFHSEAPLPVSQRAGQTYSRPAPGRFSAFLTLGPEQGLELVIGGVSYSEELPWTVPGLKIVVTGPELKTDLSRARVVRDEAFNRLMALLWDEYEDMLVQLYYYRDSVDARALPFVEQLMDLACRDELFKQAAEIGSWLRDRWDREPTGDLAAQASGLYKYAMVLRRAGKVAAGEALHKRAESMWSDLSAAGIQATLPDGTRLQGDALVQYLRCRCEETVLGSDDASFAERLTLHALRCESGSRWAEAELYRRWLLDIRAAVLKEDDPELVRRQAALASSCLRVGKLEEATALLERALEQHGTIRSEDFRLELTMLGELAALKADNDPERAAALYRRSLAVRRNKLGPDHPELIPDLQQLIALLEKLGKTGDAAALRDRLAELTQ